MDEINKKLIAKSGYCIGNNKIKIVCLADYTVLFAENEDDSECLL